MPETGQSITFSTSRISRSDIGDISATMGAGNPLSSEQLELVRNAWARDGIMQTQEYKEGEAITAMTVGGIGGLGVWGRVGNAGLTGIGGVAKSETQFWSKPIIFNGSKVYQRDDIFEASTVSTWIEKGKPVTGTNVERMASGRAPIGVDGKSVELHHMLQTNSSPIAEMTHTFHKTNHAVIHIFSNTVPSVINKTRFNTWRSNYWINRSSGF